jgi:RNA polymerase sigma-70 factor, ECF subfamily
LSADLVGTYGAAAADGDPTMTQVGDGEFARPRSAPGAERDPDDWVVALSVEGPDHHHALRRLHALLLRAARHQVSRMDTLLDGAGPDVADELTHQAADEAMVALLAKLHTFKGRSRFTTWAYKFGILQAATAVRSHAWRTRQVVLDDDVGVDLGPSVEEYAETADLARAVRRAIDEALTPHQRRIMLALLVDEVPIDVLAERLDTTRNALYKTLHDARVRVRADLTAAGYLRAATGEGNDP